MDADAPRGEGAATDREPSAPSGWVTTQQAARSLGISARTVRYHVERGNIDAKPEGEGVNKSWLVSIDSLQRFRDSRQVSGTVPRHYRDTDETADIAAEVGGNAVRELADRLAEEAAKVGEFRARLELSERAQSTLEAELAEERRRREAAERHLQRAQAEVEALKGSPGGPQGSEEGPQEPRPAPEGVRHPANPQTATSRPWWRRIIGG